MSQYTSCGLCQIAHRMSELAMPSVPSFDKDEREDKYAERLHQLHDMLRKEELNGAAVKWAIELADVVADAIAEGRFKPLKALESDRKDRT